MVRLGKIRIMNSQILTGVIAALGLMANFGLVGDVRAQHGHGEHAADHGHHHAAFESGRLHVRVDGEPGPGVREIILIPGLSSSPEIWQGTVDHLAQAPRGEGWRIHRIHIQGFAGAPAEDNAEGPVAAPVAEEIARYIAENDLDHPVIVGHSMGGTIGLMLAARHPDAIGKHDHLVIETGPGSSGRGQILALNDARRFGSVDLVDTTALEKWPQFAAMGPEPLGPAPPPHCQCECGGCQCRWRGIFARAPAATALASRAAACPLCTLRPWAWRSWRHTQPTR
jgi:pimeloyl-ACP methyl ester carboxylesterase